MLRPRWWIDRYGIEAGEFLPINIEELQVKGAALVTAIDDCPEIAEGEGSVVTARFCTREVHTIAQVEVLGLDRQIETISGTTIHPIWSEDRQDWVPLGELKPGEQLRCGRSSIQTSDFEPQTSTVLSLIILNQPIAVYNIEVHGEHVYEVGELALLVHNACNYLRGNMISSGTIFKAGEHAAHIVPVNGWKWAGDGLQKVIANVKNAGLIDDVANGFKATAGHLGTHTKEYVRVLEEVMANRTSRESILEGLSKLRNMILNGAF